MPITFGKNYKPLTRTITIAGVTIPVPHDAQIVFLHDATENSSGVDTFWDDTVSDYRIPVNFKYYPIGAFVEMDAKGTTLIYTSATLNSAEFLISSVKWGGAGTYEWLISEAGSGIQPQNYIMINPGSTGCINITLIGYIRPV